jgi:hypothetical protein
LRSYEISPGCLQVRPQIIDDEDEAFGAAPVHRVKRELEGRLHIQQPLHSWVIRLGCLIEVSGDNGREVVFESMLEHRGLELDWGTLPLGGKRNTVLFFGLSVLFHHSKFIYKIIINRH